MYCVKTNKEKQDLQYISDWKNKIEDGVSGDYGLNKRIRRYILSKYDSKCQKCGWGELNIYTNKVPLDVHHIDGDCMNNNEENLQLLCKNCHSLTQTFGSANKKSKRIFRRNKKINQGD